MPVYLLVLISVLVCVGIVAAVYGVFAYRRMAIAYKKLDYLVEDLAYKSELLTPAVNTLARLAGYGDTVGNAARKNARSLLEVLVENAPRIRKALAKEPEEGDADAKRPARKTGPR